MPLKFAESVQLTVAVTLFSINHFDPTIKRCYVRFILKKIEGSWIQRDLKEVISPKS